MTRKMITFTTEIKYALIGCDWMKISDKGFQFPTEESLARHHKCSRSTVVRALKWFFKSIENGKIVRMWVKK